MYKSEFWCSDPAALRGLNQRELEQYWAARTKEQEAILALRTLGDNPGELLLSAVLREFHPQVRAWLIRESGIKATTPPPHVKCRDWRRGGKRRKDGRGE